eukprot:758643-Hanusia_phi.AAC.4
MGNFQVPRRPGPQPPARRTVGLSDRDRAGHGPSVTEMCRRCGSARWRPVYYAPAGENCTARAPRPVGEFETRRFQEENLSKDCMSGKDLLRGMGTTMKRCDGATIGRFLSETP